MNYQNDCDEKAKEFIVRLPILTQNILTYMPEEQSREESCEDEKGLFHKAYEFKLNLINLRILFAVLQ